MKVFSKAGEITTIRLNKEEALTLRRELKCEERPIQYAGGMLLGHGYGCYQVTVRRIFIDWVSDAELKRALMKRIKQIFNHREEPLVKATPKRVLVVRPTYVHGHKRLVVKDRCRSMQQNRVDEELKYLVQELGLVPEQPRVQPSKLQELVAAFQR